MSRRNGWSRAANDIVLDTWRYARRLGRSSAERIALFNTEMQLIERRCADAIRSYAKKRLNSREAKRRRVVQARPD